MARFDDDAPAPKKPRKPRTTTFSPGTTRIVAIFVSPESLADMFTPGGWIRVTSGLPTGSRFVGSDTYNYLGRKVLKFFFAVPPIDDPLVVQRGAAVEELVVELESRRFNDNDKEDE